MTRKPILAFLFVALVVVICAATVIFRRARSDKPVLQKECPAEVVRPELPSAQPDVRTMTKREYRRAVRERRRAERLQRERELEERNRKE